MTEQVKLLQVKVMDPELVGKLSELLVDVVQDGASVGFLPPLSMEAAAAYWLDALNPGVLLWVAVREERVVGTVQLQLAMKANGSHRAEIAKLMVDPKARRGGIARLLMQTAEKAAKEEARTLLLLDTRDGDPSNHLYRSLGYIEAGRIPQFARSSSGELHTTVLYYKLCQIE
ncbi:GNAT family N-acetyltransferase [Paenibacillus filicis]|uniref:GNAT family N-acetyltransferase n=1 Tax=Paenibacillus filicis TaxID=669464 RepID=A0ABU9DTX6_9BACL